MSWAFWKYDLPPYYLGGKVKSYDKETNRATLEQWGNMIISKPILIHDDKVGHKTWLQLNALGNTTKDSISLLRSACILKAQAILSKK